MLTPQEEEGLKAVPSRLAEIEFWFRVFKWSGIFSSP
jgi:hypothetical protein